MRTAEDPAAVQTDTGTESAAMTLAREQAARPREELNLLLIGFGTGLTIGGFFLIYVVIAFTGLGG